MKSKETTLYIKSKLEQLKDLYWEFDLPAISGMHYGYETDKDGKRTPFVDLPWGQAGITRFHFPDYAFAIYKDDNYHIIPNYPTLLNILRSKHDNYYGLLPLYHETCDEHTWSGALWDVTKDTSVPSDNSCQDKSTPVSGNELVSKYDGKEIQEL